MAEDDDKKKEEEEVKLTEEQLNNYNRLIEAVEKYKQTLKEARVEEKERNRFIEQDLLTFQSKLDKEAELAAMLVKKIKKTLKDCEVIRGYPKKKKKRRTYKLKLKKSELSFLKKS